MPGAVGTRRTSDRVTRRGLLAAAGTAIARGAADCVDGDRDEPETTNETFDVNAVSRLTVEGRGRVVVHGEDRDEVAVTGEQLTASEAGLDDVWLTSDRDDVTLNGGK